AEPAIVDDDAGKLDAANQGGGEIAVHETIGGRTNVHGPQPQVRHKLTTGQRIVFIIRREADKDAGIDHLESANGTNAAIVDGDAGPADHTGYSEIYKGELIGLETVAGHG